MLGQKDGLRYQILADKKERTTQRRQEIEETELGGLDVNIHGERGYIADGAD